MSDPSRLVMAANLLRAQVIQEGKPEGRVVGFDDDHTECPSSVWTDDPRVQAGYMTCDLEDWHSGPHHDPEGWLYEEVEA